MLPTAYFSNLLALTKMILSLISASQQKYWMLQDKTKQSNLKQIPYSKDRSVPMISYAYTMHIGTKFFNHCHLLQEYNIDDFLS